MKKTKCIIFLVSMLAFQTIAQENIHKRHGFHIAYLGEMVTHPGLSIGYEKFLNYEDKFGIFLRSTLGFYRHFRNNTTYMLTLESGFRRNFRSGIFVDQSIGIGYFNRWVHGDGQFYVNENGGIEEKSGIGRSFVPFLANLGLGYHIQTNKAQFSPFIRPNFYWKMPFNETPNMQLAVMVGILYRSKK